MILLTLAYRGTAFAGFQVQPGMRTVQGTVQDAIEAIYGRRLPVVGCSRTDAGVHARDYKMTFTPAEDCPRIPTEKIPAALNTTLPDDISVLSACKMPDTFHVRHDVYEKEYEYLIYNHSIRSPFFLDTAYHYKRPLDASQLDSAAACFRGTHDFRGFMASGSDILDTVRTVRGTAVVRDENLIRIRISADGFLYNMVRIFVGTLLYVAEGKISVDTLPCLIASCDRNRAGLTVPACGLYLNRVTLKTDMMKNGNLDEKEEMSHANCTNS